MANFLVTGLSNGELHVMLCDFGSAVKYNPSTGLDAARPVPPIVETVVGWSPSGMPPETAEANAQQTQW